MSLDPGGGFWGNGDGRLLYPPQRQPAASFIPEPVTSIRLELIREGLEDREYFWLLKQQIQAGGDPDAIAEAKAALEDIGGLVPTLTRYTKDSRRLYAARERIARAIVALAKRSGS